MEDLLPGSIAALRDRTRGVADAVVASRADAVDIEGIWPAHTMRALGEEGLLGVQVPSRLGGSDQGLLALTVMTEALAAQCPSSALCFGMHCVGTAVIAAKATPWQEEQYLRPIAEGRHITTLALSESGTGAHFYIPQTRMTRDGDSLLVDGVKQFVTNAGQADSYVVSTAAADADAQPGDFSCLVIDANAQGVSFGEEWRGFGMRGNSSRALRLDGVRTPSTHLLGREGDQVWYVFEIVAPYFLTAMAGTYLGIASAALDIVMGHVRGREYVHSAETLAHAPIVQHRIAEIWMAVESARGLIYAAARLGDAGDPAALPYLLSAKAAAAETAVNVTNEAMSLAGGIGYRENGRLARLLRDARAGHVMTPTTDVLKLWLGRTLLGLPLL